MSRYIDAEPFEGMFIVKPIVFEIDLGKYCKPGHFTQQDFVKKTGIDNIPTADVQEVKHGKWKRDFSARVPLAVCDLCGLSNNQSETKYCPNCGARMDGEEYEE